MKKGQSPFSVAYRKPVFVFDDDPSLKKPGSERLLGSKIGREVIVKPTNTFNPASFDEYVYPEPEVIQKTMAYGLITGNISAPTQHLISNISIDGQVGASQVHVASTLSVDGNVSASTQNLASSISIMGYVV